MKERARGKKNAFETLYKEHGQYVYRLALLLLRTREDADEVSNDVWTKVWMHMDTYEERGLFKAWVSTITRNVAVGCLRRRKRLSKESLELIEGFETGSAADDASPWGNGQRPDPEEAWSEREDHEALKASLASLAPKYRDVVVGRAAGDSYDEIAQRLRIPMGTVMSRLFRGRQQLMLALTSRDHPFASQLPLNADNEGTGTDMADGDRQINDPKNRLAIYTLFWNLAEPDAKGVRSLRHPNPNTLAHELAQKAGIKDIGRASAGTVLSKMKDWIGLEWGGGPCRIICRVELSQLDGSAAKKPDPAPAAVVSPTRLEPKSQYPFLYKVQGKKFGHPIERAVVDPVTVLRNKRGENKDGALVVEEMIELGWCEWRNITLPGTDVAVRALILKVYPHMAAESQTAATVAITPPPGSKPATTAVPTPAKPETTPPPTKTAPAVQPTVEETPADEARPAPPATPVVDEQPATDTRPEPARAEPNEPREPLKPAAPVETKEPHVKPPSRRGPHGNKGVYLTARERKIWELFAARTTPQPKGGWNLDEAATVTFEEICQRLSPAKRDDVLESVGRFCSAQTDLLQCHAEGAYRLAWNPLNVLVKPAVRRLILAPQQRLDQVETGRAVARELMQPNGNINTTELYTQGAKRLGVTAAMVQVLLLDYASEEDGKSGSSLRVLVRPVENGNDLLLAPASLAGCDFFLAHPSRKRSVVIKPDDDLHGEYASKLRARYHEAARFKRELHGTPDKETATPPNPEPAVVVATPAPTAAAPIIDERPATEARSEPAVSVPPVAHEEEAAVETSAADPSVTEIDASVATATPDVPEELEATPPVVAPPVTPADEPTPAPAATRDEEPATASVVVEAPAPAANVPVTAPEAVDETPVEAMSAAELHVRKDELLTERARLALEEQGIRVQAEALRAQVAQLEQSADGIQARVAQLDGDLKEIDDDLRQVDELAQQMAELQRQMDDMRRQTLDIVRKRKP